MLPSGWVNGDFNYDGTVNIDDYVIIDANIGTQGAPLGSAGGIEVAVTAVPEPFATGEMVSVCCALGCASRRSRRALAFEARSRG